MATSTQEEAGGRNDRYGHHLRSALRDPPAEAGPDQQHLCEGRAVRVPAHRNGIRIFVLSRRFHRPFLDRPGSRGRPEERRR